MFLNSVGRFSTNLVISSGLLTSNWTGSILTPEPTSAVISEESSFNASIRRAVRMSLSEYGAVRANSLAVVAGDQHFVDYRFWRYKVGYCSYLPVLLPIPDEAPVMMMVLPSRRLLVAVAIARFNVGEPCTLRVQKALSGKTLFLNGRKRDMKYARTVRATSIWRG